MRLFELPADIATHARAVLTAARRLDMAHVDGPHPRMAHDLWTYALDMLEAGLVPTGLSALAALVSVAADASNASSRSTGMETSGYAVRLSYEGGAVLVGPLDSPTAHFKLTPSDRGGYDLIGLTPVGTKAIQDALRQMADNITYSVAFPVDLRGGSHQEE